MTNQEKNEYIADITPEKISEEIIKHCSVKIERKKLIDICLKNLVDPSFIKDTATDSISTKVKSKTGSILEIMIADNKVTQDKDKYILISKELKNNPDINTIQRGVKRDVIIRETVLRSLKGGPCGKEEIIARAKKELIAEDSALPDNIMRSDTCRVLSAMCKNKEIVSVGAAYRLPENAGALAALSPEDFVNKCISLLSKWFEEKGYGNITALNTDSPHDGGIDGKISGRDGLGFKENLIIQVKHQATPHVVKLCDVQQFAGAFYASAEATKAIFITNGKFNKETCDFAKKCKYLILMDGDMLLESAKNLSFAFGDN